MPIPVNNPVFRRWLLFVENVHRVIQFLIYDLGVNLCLFDRGMAKQFGHIFDPDPLPQSTCCKRMPGSMEAYLFFNLGCFGNDL